MPWIHLDEELCGIEEWTQKQVAGPVLEKENDPSRGLSSYL